MLVTTLPSLKNFALLCHIVEQMLCLDYYVKLYQDFFAQNSVLNEFSEQVCKILHKICLDLALIFGLFI